MSHNKEVKLTFYDNAVDTNRIAEVILTKFSEVILDALTDPENDGLSALWMSLC
jgi:hypothetical protein